MPNILVIDDDHGTRAALYAMLNQRKFGIFLPPDVALGKIEKTLRNEPTPRLSGLVAEILRKRGVRHQSALLGGEHRRDPRTSLLNREQRLRLAADAALKRGV
jgi:hypothetical protein